MTCYFQKLTFNAAYGSESVVTNNGWDLFWFTTRFTLSGWYYIKRVSMKEWASDMLLSAIKFHHTRHHKLIWIKVIRYIGAVKAGAVRDADTGLAAIGVQLFTLLADHN